MCGGRSGPTEDLDRVWISESQLSQVPVQLPMQVLMLADVLRPPVAIECASSLTNALAHQTNKKHNQPNWHSTARVLDLLACSSSSRRRSIVIIIVIVLISMNNHYSISY